MKYHIAIFGLFALVVGACAGSATGQAPRPTPPVVVPPTATSQVQPLTPDPACSRSMPPLPDDVPLYPGATAFQFCDRHTQPGQSLRVWQYWLPEEGSASAGPPLTWFEAEFKARNIAVTWVRDVTPFWLKSESPRVSGEIRYVMGVGAPSEAQGRRYVGVLSVRVERP